MYYIKRKGLNRKPETIAEVDTKQEGYSKLSEFRTADPCSRYYLCSSPCRKWRSDNWGEEHTLDVDEEMRRFLQ